jgi:uncharacterized protein
MGKENRGFASMNEARRREISAKGGRAVHKKGTGHEWTSETAREAGIKSGEKKLKRRFDQLLDPSAERSDRSS